MSKGKAYTAGFKHGSTAWRKSREEAAIKQAAESGFDPRNTAETQGEKWERLVRLAEARGVTVKNLK